MSSACQRGSLRASRVSIFNPRPRMLRRVQTQNGHCWNWYSFRRADWASSACCTSALCAGGFGPLIRSRKIMSWPSGQRNSRNRIFIGLNYGRKRKRAYRNDLPGIQQGCRENYESRYEARQHRGKGFDRYLRSKMNKRLSYARVHVLLTSTPAFIQRWRHRRSECSASMPSGFRSSAVHVQSSISCSAFHKNCRRR